MPRAAVPLAELQSCAVVASSVQLTSACVRQKLAGDTDGYSAADLEALLDRTVHAAATRSLAGHTTITPGSPALQQH